MIKYDSKIKFKKIYKDYVEKEFSDLKSNTRNMYYQDSFNVLYNDKGVDFWEMLGDEVRMDYAKQVIINSWKTWTDMYSENITTNNYNNYLVGIDRMNNYLNAKKQLVDKIHQESKEVNKMIVDCVLKLNQGASSQDIINELHNKIGAYKDEGFQLRIDNYLYLKGELDEVDRLMSDTLLYFLDTFENEELDFALNQVKKDMITKYKLKFYTYEYRIKQLEAYRIDRGSDISFESDMLKKIDIEPTYNLEESVWVIFDDIDEVEYKEKYNDQRIWTYQKNDLYKERIKHIPNNAEIVLANRTLKSNDYENFFDKGMYLYAKGKVIDNPKDGVSLVIDWDEEMINEDWYHDNYAADVAFVNSGSNRAWTRKNLVDFIKKGVPQDIDRYIQAYGKKQSKVDAVEEGLLEESLEDVEKSYTKEDFLSEVFISESEYDKLNSLLNNKQNIILEGAPGVGKTFTAKRLAYSRIGEINEEYVMQVQFHQSYSYEDLIMGYRPTEEHFELKTGPFYDFCVKASEDSDQDYYFIIDEINRGNISKIFGELLMLIEADKRGKEHQIKLMYSGEDFYVPKNVFIIGMMNTADRSLAMIDYAFRRRFAFYPMMPAFDNHSFKRMLDKVNNENLKRLVEGIQGVNEEIRNDDSLGKGFMIGHSYFTKDREITNAHVSNILEYEIVPLLEEYWFDDEAKVLTHVERLRNLIRE